MQPTKDTRQLNWFLAWAVVFCDIGTSVYYVPGILYGHVKDATPFFVLLTTGGFILLALKYIEISWRNPEGGGVVTITTKAFGPMWGCLGGMLITVDYFLQPCHLRRFRTSVHRQCFLCIRPTHRDPRLRRRWRLGGPKHRRHPRECHGCAGHRLCVIPGKSGCHRYGLYRHG